MWSAPVVGLTASTKRFLEGHAATWHARGDVRGGPRPYTSNRDNLISNHRQTVACERCGDMSTTEPCSRRRLLYEPARGCGDHFCDKRVHAEIADLARTAVTNPPTMQGVAALVGGERLRVAAGWPCCRPPRAVRCTHHTTSPAGGLARPRGRGRRAARPRAPASRPVRAGPSWPAAPSA